MSEHLQAFGFYLSTCPRIGPDLLGLGIYLSPRGCRAGLHFFYVSSYYVPPARAGLAGSVRVADRLRGVAGCVWLGMKVTNLNLSSQVCPGDLVTCWM